MMNCDSGRPKTEKLRCSCRTISTFQAIQMICSTWFFLIVFSIFNLNHIDGLFSHLLPQKLRIYGNGNRTKAHQNSANRRVDHDACPKKYTCSQR
jgi:hypothetical protein